MQETALERSYLNRNQDLYDTTILDAYRADSCWQLAETIAAPERQSSFESQAKKSFSIHADKTAIAKAIRLIRSKSVRTQS